MDLKIIWLIALIGIGIISEVRKFNRKTLADSQNNPNKQSPEDVNVDDVDELESANPLPQSPFFPSEHPIPSLEKTPHTRSFHTHRTYDKRAETRFHQKQNRKPKYNPQQGLPTAAPIPPQTFTIKEEIKATEISDTNDDFIIRSAEEARKAIIWGEILQRKY